MNVRAEREAVSSPRKCRIAMKLRIRGPETVLATLSTTLIFSCSALGGSGSARRALVRGPARGKHCHHVGRREAKKVTRGANEARPRGCRKSSPPTPRTRHHLHENRALREARPSVTFGRKPKQGRRAPSNDCPASARRSPKWRAWQVDTQAMISALGPDTFASPKV
jgi:hypothetical protein